MVKRCIKCGMHEVIWGDLCWKCEQQAHREKLAFKLQNDEQDSTWGEEEIFCPWCGNIYEIDDECELYEEGDHELECPECGNQFVCSTEIRFVFETIRQEED